MSDDSFRPRTAIAPTPAAPTVSRMRRDFDHEQFRDYLDAICRAANIKDDAALSRLSGVRASIISRWRRGEMQPGLDNLNRIAAVTRVPPVNLWIMAGLADHADLDMSAQPDLTAQPTEFRDLLDLYANPRVTDAQRQFMRRSVSVLVAGVRAELPARDQPRGQRKVS